jgi:transposase-like protein
LAFAIVESESLSSWMWFCERVRVAIDRSEIEISVVVSDRDKGIKEAVATVFPSASHRL